MVGQQSVYEPLRRHLDGITDPVVKMTFGDVERGLGRPLPASSRKHRAWWSNEAVGTHSHARSWLDTRRTTRNVDLNAATVEFVK
jgi:hypothetical protein